jgi:hypothetical protein
VIGSRKLELAATPTAPADRMSASAPRGRWRIIARQSRGRAYAARANRAAGAASPPDERRCANRGRPALLTCATPSCQLPVAGLARGVLVRCLTGRPAHPIGRIRAHWPYRGSRRLLRTSCMRPCSASLRQGAVLGGGRSSRPLTAFSSLLPPNRPRGDGRSGRQPFHSPKKRFSVMGSR